ncbi:MAG: T9SS type A sorting domain-containing protein, partial [Panacibacter sp.]
GINGVACGSCSYTIVVDCIDCKKCKKNIVRNYSLINIPTFPGSSNISTTASANWFATSNSPQYYASVPGDTGGCDSGFVSMWGNKFVGEQITQTGLAIIAGRQYQIKFAGKFGGASNSSYVQFRFMASNTIPVGFYGSGITSIGGVQMGVSPAITSTTAYNTYSFTWTAPANFSVVSINPENQWNTNDGNDVSWGRIDNVCVTDVTPGVAENGTDVSEALSNQITTVRVSASPNPFNNSFRINGLQNKAASLDIVNMQGTTVGHYSSIKEGSSFGSNLSAGTYLLRIIFKDGTSQSLKLIKN